MAGIDQLIINSAYREPTHHWKYDLNGQTFVREAGRAPPGILLPVRVPINIMILDNLSSFRLSTGSALV